MKMHRHLADVALLFFVLAMSLLASSASAQATDTQSAKAQADPLPSWNDKAAKQAILEYVEKVTRADSPDFVPVPQRIAVLDNDGTLWPEYPIPFQLAFALDDVKR